MLAQGSSATRSRRVSLLVALVTAFMLLVLLPRAAVGATMTWAAAAERGYDAVASSRTGHVGRAMGAEPTDLLHPVQRRGLVPWSVALSPMDTPRFATNPAGARFSVDSAGVVTDAVGRAPNAVSLGRFPGYVDDAAATGSRTFNLGDAWEGMSEAEIWTRNTRFLDGAVARGSEIRLTSNPADPANAGSWFLKEVEYLRSKGYEVVDGGTRMVRR